MTQGGAGTNDKEAEGAAVTPLIKLHCGIEFFVARAESNPCPAALPRISFTETSLSTSLAKSKRQSLREFISFFV